ncbi:hypothetical protein [Xanthomonas tesorieronis]|uniref:hypothetical protein n=1 Tax=Xanthomonas tesorieronis TaxID=3160839 RepID=UPI003511CFF5
MRRLSPVGMVCCLLYAGFIAYFQWAAQTPGIDPESMLFCRELPVALPLILLNGLFLGPVLDRLPWMVVFVCLAGVMFAALYLLGSWLEKEFRRSQANRRAMSARRGGSEQ